MKRLLVFLTVIAFGFSGTLFAQNSEGKADDAARISITPQVTAQEIPQGAKNMLMNKMKQICTKNGLAGDGNNPFFIMDATVDILSKELTPTAPPMHALYLSVNFFIKDAKSGAIYSESSIEIKGVGKNETKAYSQALKNINTSKGQFKAMVEKGKVKIIEFYNSECDFIISKATALHKQGNNADAIKVLESVPSVSKECFAKCMELLSEIEPPVEPVATTTAASSGSTPTNAISGEMEIDTDIFLVYLGSKTLGDKMLLNFEFENRGDKDYELDDYVFDTRIVDQNGAAHKTLSQSVGENVGAKARFTIIPGVPVKSAFEFPVVDAVTMFEYKYKDRIFRLKDVQLTGSTQKSNGNSTSNASASVSNSGSYSNLVGYDGAKVVFNKTTKYGNLRLPMNEFGEFGGDRSFKGKIVRYQFSTSADNNPEYILMMAKKALANKGYEILVSQESLDQFFEEKYFKRLDNHRFGSKWGFFQNSNCTYLIAKTSSGNKDIYVSIYIWAEKDYTGINQDVVEVE